MTKNIDDDMAVDTTNATLYLSYRAELERRNRYNSHARDTSILVLSCVFLTLSIVLSHTTSSVFFVTVAHDLFGLSIILTIVSFTVGDVALEKSLARAEEYYLRDGDYNDRSGLSSINNGLNYFVTPTVFILALICMLVSVLDRF